MGILCIDVGGSFLKHTVLDDELDIKKVSSAVTPRNDLNSFLREIRKIYDRYQGISGIAVSIPGIIDTERGFMYTGGSLDYIRDIPMAETISELCDGLPVSIENDAKAAATAELYAGVLKHAKNGIILTLGTAVGGTVIVDKKILRGKNLFAGEMSYAIYHDDGVRDDSWDVQSNMWGCRSIPAQIVRTYGDEALRCEDIFDRLVKGDPRADQAVRAEARDAALLAHNLQCIFDPEVIAFGGGISAEQDYIQLIREEAKKINGLFHGVVPLPRIEACRFYNNANLLGAYFAFQNMDRSAAGEWSVRGKGVLQA